MLYLERDKKNTVFSERKSYSPSSDDGPSDFKYWVLSCDAMLPCICRVLLDYDAPLVKGNGT